MKDFFQICYIVFLLSVTFNQYFVHSQGKIDSLYVELEKYDSDSNKARLLIKINEELKAKYSIANNLFKIGEYNKSINILNELILRYQSNKDTFNTSKALLLLGKNYNLKGYKDSALVYIRNAIKTSKILDNKTIYCNILQFCGNIYYEMGYSDSSLFYYHKALDISEEIRYLTFIPELHLNIAKIHNQYFNFEQEIKYLNLAKEEFSILGNQNGIARCRLNLGYNLGDNGYYKEAINEYLQSYKIFTQLNDFENQSIASLNIGKTYKKIEMLDSSIIYLEKAIIAGQKSNDIEYVCNPLVSIGWAYLENFDKEISQNTKNEFLILSNQSGIKALELSKDLNNQSLNKDVSELLWAINFRKGNFKEALKYAEHYIQSQESLFNNEKLNSINKMESRYQAEKKQLEIDKLESEQLLKDELLKSKDEQADRVRLIRNLFIFGFIAILTFAILLLRQFRQKKEANELLNLQKKEIEDKNKALELLVKQVTEQKEEISNEKGISDKLRQIDSMKDEFLANTSHELKTPLTGIIGLAESVIDGAAGKINKKVSYNLSMIVQSGKRLTTLVNDILDFSKLRNHELVVNQKTIGLKPMVDIILELSKPLTFSKNIILENEISRDIPPVLADENRLQQVLFNLIGNAIKFTEKGSVKISAIAKKEMVEISVTDTGIGIPEDKLDTIFLSFQQVDSSTTRKYGGTGLGLAVSSQLIQLMKGEVRVKSELDKGSVFTFSLPISNDKVEVNKLENNISKVAGDVLNYLSKPIVTKGEFNILVVDDEPVNQQVLANHLSFENYSIHQAYNGMDALEAINNADPQFDLVLLDIMMPRMSGYEVCQKIREKYMPSELPVIMITAKDQLSDLLEGFSSGANDYIAKPFSKDELLARIKTHLSIHKINAAYERFVPCDFMKALKKDSILDIKLGDHVEGEMTILFADIRSFTTISEEMTPEQNFKFLNAYLKHCIPAIQKNEGFIDKYIGDAIMAIFPYKADDAVKASVQMLRDLEKYNSKRKKDNRNPINIGIGLHTGNLMLGTIGNEKRMDGTVISDSVNLASRLEGLTKTFGASIVISENTLNGIKIKEEYNYRFLFKVQVKGKNKTVDVYEVFDGDSKESFDLKLKTKHLYEQAFKHYFKKEFSKALPLLEDVLKQNPDDKAARIYLERLANFIVNPVNNDWEGIESMNGK